MKNRSATNAVALARRYTPHLAATLAVAGCFWGGDGSSRNDRRTDTDPIHTVTTGDGGTTEDGGTPGPCALGECPSFSCYCGDGSRSDGGGCAATGSSCMDEQAFCTDGCASRGGWPSAPPAGAKRVFVTATAHVSDLGGLLGADRICESAADAAELGGAWRAWLSDSREDAISRIPDVGPWFDLRGRKVFNNHANLTTSPLIPLAINEQRDDNFGAWWVWTGTWAGGEGAGQGDQAFCADWGRGFSTLWEAEAGSSSTADERWTADVVLQCGTAAHLYCFET